MSDQCFRMSSPAVRTVLLLCAKSLFGFRNDSALRATKQHALSQHLLPSLFFRISLFPRSMHNQMFRGGGITSLIPAP
jgi:hypothetical protein